MPHPLWRNCTSADVDLAWIERAAAQGFVEAQVLWGQALLDRGDPALALRWFQAAAGARHAPAVNMLGRCFEHGWGTAPDLVRAATLYRQAAEAGEAWGQYNLAMALLQGRGVAQDRSSAHAWFGRAAAQGNVKAPNMLGRFHEEGWGGPRDLVRAADCYRQGAAAGDFRAQFNLGVLLWQHGDRAEALTLLHRAWAAGTPDFRVEAGSSLRGTGDAALMAVARTA